LNVRPVDIHEMDSDEFINTYWSKSTAKIEDDIAESAKGLF